MQEFSVGSKSNLTPYTRAAYGLMILAKILVLRSGGETLGNNEKSFSTVIA
jgi:hypothetical protein